jgi:hypothetical protein
MPVHRTVRGLAAASLLAGLVSAPAAAAGPTVLVDATPGVTLAASTARGDDLVVAWRERVDGFRVPVATASADGGASWLPPRPVTGLADAGQVDADVCAGVAVLTFVSDLGTPAHPDRAAAVISFHATGSDGGWNNFGIATGKVRDARVACRGLQPVIAWAAFADGAWRLRAQLWGEAEDYLPGGITPPVRQTLRLGRMTGATRHAPSIDADADRALIAWIGGGRLRVTRLETDATAPHDLVRLDDRVLATGTRQRPLGDPLIALDGDRVVVAWTSCGDLFARVSDDGGATFDPAIRLFDGRCAGTPSARLDGLAAADGRVAVTARIRRANGPQARILTSDDGLATRSWLTLDRAGDRWIGGWVGGPSPELGATGDLGASIAWYPPGTLEP